MLNLPLWVQNLSLWHVVELDVFGSEVAGNCSLHSAIDCVMPRHGVCLVCGAERNADSPWTYCSYKLWYALPNSYRTRLWCVRTRKRTYYADASAGSSQPNASDTTADMGPEFLEKYYFSVCNRNKCFSKLVVHWAKDLPED